MRSPIDHETARGLAALAAGGDADGEELATLRQHLDGCPPCAAEAGALTRAVSALAVLPRGALHAHPGAPPPPQASTRLGLGIALAVTAVALIALAATWSWRALPTRSPSPPPPESVVLYQVFLGPEDSRPHHRARGLLPARKGLVVSARALPILPPARRPGRSATGDLAAGEGGAREGGAASTADTLGLAPTAPTPIAPEGEVRGRTMLTSGGHRLLPAPRLVLQAGESWSLHELPE